MIYKYIKIVGALALSACMIVVKVEGTKPAAGIEEQNALAIVTPYTSMINGGVYINADHIHLIDQTGSVYTGSVETTDGQIVYFRIDETTHTMTVSHADIPDALPSADDKAVADLISVIKNSSQIVVDGANFLTESDKKLALLIKSLPRDDYNALMSVSSPHHAIVHYDHDHSIFSYQIDNGPVRVMSVDAATAGTGSSAHDIYTVSDGFEFLSDDESVSVKSFFEYLGHSFHEFHFEPKFLSLLTLPVAAGVAGACAVLPYKMNRLLNESLGLSAITNIVAEGQIEVQVVRAPSRTTRGRVVLVEKPLVGRVSQLDCVVSGSTLMLAVQGKVPSLKKYKVVFFAPNPELIVSKQATGKAVIN